MHIGTQACLNIKKIRLRALQGISSELGLCGQVSQESWLGAIGSLEFIPLKSKLVGGVRFHVVESVERWRQFPKTFIWVIYMFFPKVFFRKNIPHLQHLQQYNENNYLQVELRGTCGG